VDLPSYKMGGFSIAMLVITRGYPKGGLEHGLKQPKLGTSVDRGTVPLGRPEIQKFKGALDTMADTAI